MLTFDEFHAVRTRQRQSDAEAAADRKTNGDSRSAAVGNKRPAQRSAARDAHDDDLKELDVSAASCNNYNNCSSNTCSTCLDLTESAAICSRTRLATAQHRQKCNLNNILLALYCSSSDTCHTRPSYYLACTAGR